MPSLNYIIRISLIYKDFSYMNDDNLLSIYGQFSKHLILVKKLFLLHKEIGSGRRRDKSFNKLLIITFCQ